MKQLTSMAWKEWHEARAFLWIGLSVFVGLPLIGSVEAMFQYSHRFVIDTTPWVMYFGGVLALFVAVGITCRDFHGHLEDFWRSRPVSVVRWLIVKYFVGLLVVMGSCALPLGIEWMVNRTSDPSTQQTIVDMLAFLPVVWMLIYSLGFLAGCLIRRPAHAAMMSLAALLFLYFVLMILPPSRWVSFGWILSQNNVNFMLSPIYGPSWLIWYLWYAAPALILGLSILLLSLLAVRRGWRIDSNRQLMYGVVAAAFLAMIASAGVQLGSNLPVQWEMDLPNHEQVLMLRVDGTEGFMITSVPSGQTLFDAGMGQRFDPNPGVAFRRLQLTNTGVRLGNAITLESVGGPDSQAWAPGHPEVQYIVERSSETSQGMFELRTMQLDQSYDWRNPAVPLWPYTSKTPAEYSRGDGARIYAFQDRLYVIGSHLVTLDISQPRAPSIISDEPFPYAFGISEMNLDKLIVRLPPVPGLPPRQRLEAALGMDAPLEGDTFCFGYSGNIVAFHLAQLTDLKAVFEPIGHYSATILQRAFGASRHEGLKLVNGFLYDGATYEDREFDTHYRRDDFFNPRVDVFDLRGSTPLRSVGHFAAPGARIVCPLPDGRALVGGDKLWLIGVPPRDAAE